MGNRIIPALAGNTVRTPDQVRAVQDHPRSRGEYLGATRRGRCRWGSSPLSRGIHPKVAFSADLAGIIPALAGNTCCPSRSVAGSRDHPRSRGEYPRYRAPRRRQPGSSPLSRGIHTMDHATFLPGRIIPALAGNTCEQNWYTQIDRDHPRSRGEYLGATRRGRCHWGSSPLSRGIPHRGIVKGHAPRIIPALAGNTSTRSSSSAAMWDHPRSRGEYARRKTITAAQAGSSPLSRGILCMGRGLRVPARIIPALAGNTLGCNGRRKRLWDHPRSRGEYSVSVASHTRRPGSSPLSRGIPLLRRKFPL